MYILFDMKRFYQVGILASVGFALVMNYLVGAQVLSVPSIGEMSDKYSTLLTPATYAFSIWSLIYLLIVGFAVYQARDLLNPQKDNDLPTRTGPYLIIANVMNGLWTYIFVKDWIAVSVIVLATLVVSLYIVLYRLNIARDTPTLKTAVFAWWPLLIYTGWVTVALVVNIASWLRSVDIILSSLIASLIIFALFGILMYLLFTRNVRELVLTSAWGIAAVGVQQTQLDNGDGVIAATAFCATGALVLAVLVHAAQKLRTGQALMRTKQ